MVISVISERNVKSKFSMGIIRQNMLNISDLVFFKSGAKEVLRYLKRKE